MKERLIYRPCSVKNAVILVLIGLVLDAGAAGWAVCTSVSLSSFGWLLLVGLVFALYGLFYVYKNLQLLIFDAEVGCIAIKTPFGREKEIGRFDWVYAIQKVTEFHTFYYILKLKSQFGGTEIIISDTFYANSLEPGRQEYEARILPVIESMLQQGVNAGGKTKPQVEIRVTQYR